MREQWDIRTLLEGHQALRQLLAATPATSIKASLLIALSTAERKLRPVTELSQARRQALADELGLPLSPDGQRYTTPPGEDGPAKMQQFQDAMKEWLNEPYLIEFDPIPWGEAVASIRGMTGLHYSLMPFLFSMGEEGAG